MGPEGEPAANGRGGSIPSAPPAAEVEALVRSLIGMMGGGGIHELDLVFGAVSVRLRANVAATQPVAVASAAVAADDGAEKGREHVVAAPMIGTFYASPSPGEPPFVEVGDPVEVGQTIGIIEAMKIMNEIAADRAGVVTAVLAANGQPVEYGFPLLRVRGADAG